VRPGRTWSSAIIVAAGDDTRESVGDGRREAIAECTRRNVTSRGEPHRSTHSPPATDLHNTDRLPPTRTRLHPLRLTTPAVATHGSQNSSDTSLSTRFMPLVEDSAWPPPLPFPFPLLLSLEEGLGLRGVVWR